MDAENRLTIRLPSGVITRNYAIKESAMRRLAAYEDTGFTPEEVGELFWELAAAKRRKALRESSEPTIDVVEVVRCRDCRFSNPIPEHAAKAFNAELVRDCTYQRGDWKQVYGFSVVSVDGFCDEGERRVDAEDNT